MLIFTLGVVTGFFTFPILSLVIQKINDIKEDNEDYKHGRQGDR